MIEYLRICSVPSDNILRRKSSHTRLIFPRYLLDLTKPYHNLLELHKGKHRQTFYWDMNVSAMEDENRTLLPLSSGNPLLSFLMAVLLPAAS